MCLAVNSHETGRSREQKSEIQDYDVDYESSLPRPPVSPSLPLSLSLLSADGRSAAQLLSAAYKKCCAFNQGF